MKSKDVAQLQKNLIESKRRSIAGLTEQIDKLDEQRDELWRRWNKLRSLRSNLESDVIELERELRANSNAHTNPATE